MTVRTDGRPARHRLLRCALVAALACLAVLAGAGPASAHAQLVSSTPGNGAVVAQAPEAVTLEFNEAVTARPKETHVFDGTGAEIPIEVTTADRTVTLTPSRALPTGTIVVGYAIISADGHPIEGSITFAVGAPTEGASANAVFDEPVTAGLGVAHRAAIGVAVLAGVVLIGSVLAGRALAGRDTWIRASWLVGLVAVVLLVPLGAADRNGLGWAGVRDWTQWVDGWVSWRGLLLGVGVAAAACAATWRGRWPAAAAALVLVAAVPVAVVAPGPAIAEAPQPGGPPVAEATSGEHTVRVTLDSTRAGTTGFRLEVLDADDNPVEPFAEPTLRAIGDDLTLDLDLAKESAGVWTGTVTLPAPGEWTMEASVRFDKFDNPVLSLPFTIGSRVAAVPTGGH